MEGGSVSWNRMGGQALGSKGVKMGDRPRGREWSFIRTRGIVLKDE